LASELRPNPRNWRTHPSEQQDALRGVLAEVGYADALLARELPDGALELIDGHLRAETTPDNMVPVLVLDVDEAEATKILLTHDPLASMAGASQEQLQSLLADVETENSAVQALLDSIEKDAEDSKNLFDHPSDLPEVDIPESYQVVVECCDEEEQKNMYDRMKGEGYKCRVLTL